MIVVGGRGGQHAAGRQTAHRAARLPQEETLLIGIVPGRGGGRRQQQRVSHQGGLRVAHAEPPQGGDGALPGPGRQGRARRREQFRGAGSRRLGAGRGNAETGGPRRSRERQYSAHRTPQDPDAAAGLTRYQSNGTRRMSSMFLVP